MESQCFSRDYYFQLDYFLFLQSLVENSEIGGDADVGKLRGVITEVEKDIHLLKGEQEELKEQQNKLNKDITKLRNAGMIF